MEQARAPLPAPLAMLCGAFGDMVLLTAMIRQLHARFGVAVDLVSSGAWTLPLLEGQPGVGRIYTVGSRRRSYWLSPDQRQLVRALRRRAPGPTWYCENQPVGRDLLRRAKIPDSWVCDAGDFPWREGEHFVEYWVRFGCSTPSGLRDRIADGQPAVPAAAALEVRPEQRAELDGWLETRGLAGQPLLLIQAGSKRTMRGRNPARASNTKYWPESRWADVIRAMRTQRPGHVILMLGVPHEWSLNEEIARVADVERLYNVADDVPLTRLLALLERAECLVSVDTGPAHAAAAVGCPVVVLFGAADETRYRPSGIDTPVVCLTGTVDGERTILGIEPASVVDAWCELMRR
jgi:heptosyltransferase-2/heptosyltransferase-3